MPTVLIAMAPVPIAMAPVPNSIGNSPAAARTAPPTPPPRWWEPWRRFGELRGRPPGLAARVYGRAWWRMARHGRAWGALAIVMAIGVACGEVFPLIPPDRWALGWVIVLALSVLLPELLGRLWHPTLARCIRIELGTHCPACDYDLRTTPDPAGPRHGRCPECGKVTNAPPPAGPPAPSDLDVQ